MYGFGRRGGDNQPCTVEEKFVAWYGSSVRAVVREGTAGAGAEEPGETPLLALPVPNPTLTSFDQHLLLSPCILPMAGVGSNTMSNGTTGHVDKPLCFVSESHYYSFDNNIQTADPTSTCDTWIHSTLVYSSDRAREIFGRFVAIVQVIRRRRLGNFRSAPPACPPPPARCVHPYDRTPYG